jgi:hypothetical protein
LSNFIYKTKYICYIDLYKEQEKEKSAMKTTQLDNGTLNNYATEPQISYAEYPALYEQRRYLQQAAIATLLVTALVLVSFVVS